MSGLQGVRNAWRPTPSTAPPTRPGWSLTRRYFLVLLPVLLRQCKSLKSIQSFLTPRNLVSYYSLVYQHHLPSISLYLLTYQFSKSCAYCVIQTAGLWQNVQSRSTPSLDLSPVIWWSRRIS